MLVKRSKTIRRVSRTFLLKRTKDSEYPYACSLCIFDNKKCKFSDFDCEDFDTFEYSFVVKKKLVHRQRKRNDKTGD